MAYSRPSWRDGARPGWILLWIIAGIVLGVVMCCGSMFLAVRCRAGRIMVQGHQSAVCHDRDPTGRTGPATVGPQHQPALRMRRTLSAYSFAADRARWSRPHRVAVERGSVVRIGRGLWPGSAVSIRSGEGLR